MAQKYQVNTWASVQTESPFFTQVRSSYTNFYNNNKLYFNPYNWKTELIEPQKSNFDKNCSKHLPVMALQFKPLFFPIFIKYFFKYEAWVKF